MNIIERHLEVVNGFTSDAEREVAATIVSCAMNSHDDGVQLAQKILYGIMEGAPIRYLSSYTPYSNFPRHASPYQSYSRHITYQSMDKFLACLQGAVAYGTMENFYHKLIRKRDAYAHEALCRMFPNIDFLPSLNSKATYRGYHHLLYLLTYKTKIWKKPISARRLIPCDDAIFERAEENGFIRLSSTSQLKIAEEITDVACRKYGDENFYKLYETLAL